jgi:HSP20 family protein
MVRIRRFVPMRDFVSMNDARNRLLDSNQFAYAGAANDAAAGLRRRLPLDAYTTENEFVIVADLPGLKPDDVEITVEGEELTIRGEFLPPLQEVENLHYIMQERAYGPFERRLTFNVPVDVENIEASFEAGQLKLIVPKAEEVRPKQIKVQAR